MNEVFRFLDILKKFKLTLIIIPLVTTIITFFLVRNLPNSYISQAQIATGWVDGTQQQSVVGQLDDKDRINQKFSNLMEMMRMNRILDQVAYELIIHDLTNPVPFKAWSTELLALSDSEKAQAIKVFRQKLADHQSLTLSNPAENKLYNLLKSMDYDAESIRNKQLIYRPSDSDFIVVQFESENPDLSALVVNLVSAEVIENYSTSLKENQLKANNFLSGMLVQKSDSLSQRMEKLRAYKIKNRVLNLTEQSKQLYTLVLEYDTKKQEAIEKTASYAGALNQINRKFDPRERSYIEAALSKVNQSIVDTKDELSSIYTLYINNDLDPRYKSSYDSLSRKLTAQINKSSDQYITNPLNTKQELINQKMTMEIQLDMTRFSINSLDKKLRSLNNQFETMVPKEADVQSL
jgi:succinoglycan biosynthesis transport protein ExoP